MPGHDERTIKQLVDGAAASADVLLAAESDPLSYALLAQHIDTTVAALNYFGVGRRDSVAFVLPNGPLAASAFLALSCGATWSSFPVLFRHHEARSTPPRQGPSF